MRIATILAAGLFAVTAVYADGHEGKMSAEEAAMMAALEASMTPGKEHEWLASLVGEFDAEVKTYTAPGAPPEIAQSKVVRTVELDGRVLHEVWTGSVMGMPFTGIGRLGYDNVTKRYWTTWTDNISTGLFIGYGQWDKSRERLIFEGEMPDPMSGQMVPTRSVATYPDENRETMLMYENSTGTERLTMEFSLTRR
ncbi:MAG: DUF1579 domain-containing protein [Pseudomonadota bacterium]